MFRRIAARAALPVLFAVLAGCDRVPESASPDQAEGASVREVANAQDFNCEPVWVEGGDGPIWCADGVRVRIAGISARNLSGQCRPDAPCPAASGLASQAVLVELIGYRQGDTPDGRIRVDGDYLHCRSNGIVEPGLTEASCTSLYSGDIACGMMASLTVERDPDFDPERRLAACAENRGQAEAPFATLPAANRFSPPSE